MKKFLPFILSCIFSAQATTYTCLQVKDISSLKIGDPISKIKSQTSSTSVTKKNLVAAQKACPKDTNVIFDEDSKIVALKKNGNWKSS